MLLDNNVNIKTRYCRLKLRIWFQYNQWNWKFSNDTRKWCNTEKAQIFLKRLASFLGNEFRETLNKRGIEIQKGGVYGQVNHDRYTILKKLYSFFLRWIIFYSVRIWKVYIFEKYSPQKNYRFILFFKGIELITASNL